MSQETQLREWVEQLKLRAERAEAKLASLAKVVDAADKFNEASTDNQVAAAASLHEAIAYQQLEQAESDRDKALSQVKLLVEALETTRETLREVHSGMTDNVARTLGSLSGILAAVKGQP